mmetsp:Transcript_65982/g.212834  ORF Transcript_65982/g.212834 Transcript_65982/m.212834 type:complete len:279 (-) Transcript_65982:1401-2237(-)
MASTGRGRSRGPWEPSKGCPLAAKPPPTAGRPPLYSGTCAACLERLRCCPRDRTCQATAGPGPLVGEQRDCNAKTPFDFGGARALPAICSALMLQPGRAFPAAPCGGPAAQGPPAVPAQAHQRWAVAAAWAPSAWLRWGMLLAALRPRQAPAASSVAGCCSRCSSTGAWAIAALRARPSSRGRPAAAAASSAIAARRAPPWCRCSAAARAQAPRPAAPRWGPRRRTPRCGTAAGCSHGTRRGPRAGARGPRAAGRPAASARAGSGPRMAPQPRPPAVV